MGISVGTCVGIRLPVQSALVGMECAIFFVMSLVYLQKQHLDNLLQIPFLIAKCNFFPTTKMSKN